MTSEPNAVEQAREAWREDVVALYGVHADDAMLGWRMGLLDAMIAAVRADERERCVRIADVMTVAAIRALGEEA